MRLTNLIAKSEQRPLLCRQAASQLPERSRQPGTGDCTVCVGCSVACGDYGVARYALTLHTSCRLLSSSQSHSLPHSTLPVEQRIDTALLNSALTSVVCALPERCLPEHCKLRSSRCLRVFLPHWYSSLTQLIDTLTRRTHTICCRRDDNGYYCC